MKLDVQLGNSGHSAHTFGILHTSPVAHSTSEGVFNYLRVTSPDNRQTVRLLQTQSKVHEQAELY